MLIAESTVDFDTQWDTGEESSVELPLESVYIRKESSTVVGLSGIKCSTWSASGQS